MDRKTDMYILAGLTKVEEKLLTGGRPYPSSLEVNIDLTVTSPLYTRKQNKQDAEYNCEIGGDSILPMN